MIRLKHPRRRSDTPAYWLSQAADVALELVAAKNYTDLKHHLARVAKEQHVAPWVVIEGIRREWLRWGVVGDEIVASLGGAKDLG